MAKNENGLTDKQELFCLEYLTDVNATQSAIRAGYAKRSARAIGQKNMTKHDIKKRILQLMDERKNEVKLEQARVIKEYMDIAFVNIQDAFDDDGKLLPIKDIPENVARAIGGIDVSVFGNEDSGIEIIKKIKLIDKKGSLDSLGKHLGMFIQKVEVKNTDSKVLEMTQMSRDELMKRAEESNRKIKKMLSDYEKQNEN
jgi:phage terminase small subunit